jgi:hypothetical protein
MKMAHEQVWYYSTDISGETYNQCRDREDAIMCLDGGVGFVGKGCTPPVLMSTQIDADLMIEGFEDDLCDVSDGNGIFACASKDQVNDLEVRLRKAADDWQEHHKLTFNQWTIEWSEGPEEIKQSKNKE